jgi:hypothetical protein
VALYLLHYREKPLNKPTINKWGSSFGMTPIFMDREGLLRPSRSVKIFRHINEALADPDLAQLTWVWLHSSGDTILDEFDHPKDNAIYCIGSDRVGFERDVSQLPHHHVRLRLEGDQYAAIATALTVYDRYLYLIGRRK